MIKKIIFIAFLIILSIFISNILNYNDVVSIATSRYQITMNLSFLFFLSVAAFLIFYLLIYILVAMFYPSVSNYKNNERKLKKKISQYINLMTEAFIFKSIKNNKEALKKLKKADKIYGETNLSKLLESQLFFLDRDYKKSEVIFKKIDDIDLNIDLLALKFNFEQSVRLNDEENSEKYAKQILKVEPTNRDCLETLFSIYYKKMDWENANNILQIGLKSGIFSQDKYKDKILFIYTALGKKLYESNELFRAKKVLRLAYKLDSNYIQATILLVQTYISLGKTQKAIKIIKKVWRHNANPKLANLYFSIVPERKSIRTAEVLYRLNSRSYESNFILATAYFNNKIFSKARKYAKIAENICPSKEIYELMLKIEQEDNGSSAMVNNFKNKILTSKNPGWQCDVCKKEYNVWQDQCNNCKSLDSIFWADDKK